MAIQHTERPGGHPVLGFARALEGALDKVSDCEPVFMTASQKAQALRELHRAEQRLAGLRLRVLAVSGDVAEGTGARDASSWLADQTRTERGPNAADLALGQVLDRSWHRLGAGLGEGRVSLAQARVIAHALDDLPDDLDPELVTKAEEHLVDQATIYRPRELVVLGRRILEVIAPDLVEDEEGRRLEAEERRARETTSLHTKRLGDGSSRITLKVTDATADRLVTCLDAFTSPRHDQPGDPSAGSGMFARTGEGDRIPVHRKRGHAFAALLEALDPENLPEHGGDATTVIVTLSLDQLRASLAAAGVITSDEGAISATETRRLACTGQIIPAVLGSEGQVLDLGRGSRLFTKAQRKALRLRDGHCRAEGCTIPAGWCEAHHWDPWSTGGPTDLDNGLLLCNWHHHRAHDQHYRTDRLPNGDIRFNRRT